MQADLLDVLTRLASASNIRCMRVTPPFDGLDQFDYGLRKALDPYFDWQEFGSLLLQSTDRKSTRLNSSHTRPSRMPSSA